MTNMISQKLLPIIIHCSAHRSVVRKDSFRGVLKFDVLKLTEVVSQQSNNVLPQRHQDSKVHKAREPINVQFQISNFATFAN